MQPVTHDSKNWILAVWAVIAIGLALRIATSFQSFWLDEIWSYYLAQELESLWQVFTERRHDNNHILNTLFIAAIGEYESGFAYRLLSLVTGTASVVWLTLIARGRGTPEMLAVAVLAAVSYPMVIASAQARGYAAAIFFSLVALHWARQRNAGAIRSWPSVLGFWSVCALGILSQLTFLYAYLSILAWTGARVLRAPSRAAWIELLRWHAVPVASVALLYMVFYREIVIGGGDRSYDVLLVVRQVIASALIATTSGALTLPAVLVAVAICVSGIWLLRDEPGRSWIFFIGAVALVPVSILIIVQPRLLYPRYFWASVPYLYLLCAYGLGWIYGRSGGGKLLYCIVLLAFATTHFVKNVEHLSSGRTHYADTLAYLESHTDGNTIRIGTDHDFRNSMVLRFYARYRGAGKTIAIRDSGSWTGTGPEWYLRHSWLAGRNPAERITLDGGRSYTQVARFDHGIGYGWTWFVYRNDRLQ